MQKRPRRSLERNMVFDPDCPRRPVRLVGRRMAPRIIQLCPSLKCYHIRAGVSSGRSLLGALRRNEVGSWHRKVGALLNALLCCPVYDARQSLNSRHHHSVGIAGAKLSDIPGYVRVVFQASTLGDERIHQLPYHCLLVRPRRQNRAMGDPPGDARQSLSQIGRATSPRESRQELCYRLIEGREAALHD